MYPGICDLFLSQSKKVLTFFHYEELNAGITRSRDNQEGFGKGS